MLHGWENFFIMAGTAAATLVGLLFVAGTYLIVGAVGLLAERSFAPYAIAGAIVLLLFAGIYGAWDCHVVDGSRTGRRLSDAMTKTSVVV